MWKRTTCEQAGKITKEKPSNRVRRSLWRGADFFCIFSIVCKNSANFGVNLQFLARAKHERVVQDEVEKANRRPTRHGPTPLTPYLKIDNF